jgi:hypothetical protein
MGFAARVDDMGKPAWIALLVLTFIIAWPIGLALLAYLIWSGRMGCGSHGRWHGRNERVERWRENWRRSPWSGSSGNAAFDEYRAETLTRLEEEEKEFRDFLDRLRKAKDKAEFDQFMADRKKPQGPIIDGEQPA